MSSTSTSKQQGKSLLYLAPISGRTNLIALSVLFIILFLLRFQVFLGLETYYLGGSHADAGLYLWLFRENLHNFFALPFFQTTAFFPYPLSLAWTDNFLFPSLLAYPFYKLGIPESVLYNFVLLGAHLLLGYCTFRFTFIISGEKVCSLAAGIGVMLLGYITNALGHPQLQFGYCFPLATELLFRSLHKPMRSGLLFGALFFVTFLTTVYFAIFLAIIPPIFFVTLLCMYPRREIAVTTGYFALGGLVCLPFLYPFLTPYFAIKEVFGERAIQEMFSFRADGLSLLSAPPLSLLYGFTSSFAHAEAHLFPGLLILISVFIPFVHLYDTPSLKWFGRSAAFTLLLSLLLSSKTILAALSVPEGVSSFFLTFGFPFLSYLTIAAFMLLFFQTGRVERSLGVAHITTRGMYAVLFMIALCFLLISFGPSTKSDSYQLSLFSLFYALVPGFDSVRAISRAALPSLICFATLFGLALWQLKQWRGLSRFLIVVLLLVVAVENWTTNYALEPRDGAPVVLKKLQSMKNNNDVVLFLPMTDQVKPNRTVKSWGNFALRNIDFMNWALDYGLTTVNAYSGQRSKIMKDLPGQTEAFPDARSLDAIAHITNVRFIVFQSKHVPNFNPVQFEAEYEYLQNSLQFIEKDGEGYYLFRFTGETKVSSRDTFRAPSHWGDGHSGGTFSFEVKPPYDPNTESEQLVIKELDHANGTIGSVLLNTSGKWQSFTVELPKQASPALPFRLQFEGPSFKRTPFRELKVEPKARLSE